MKEYRNVRSTLKPEPVVICDSSISLCTDISYITENLGADNEFMGYEFTMQVYAKDEYILKLSEDIRRLNRILDSPEE